MSTPATIKLFVDAHVFDGKFQGSRTFLKEIYILLAAKEGVQLYLGAYDIDNLKRCFPIGANINFVKYRSRSAFIRLGYDIPLIIKKYKIGYAHFQYIVPFIKNCRFIVTTHDVIFNECPEEFSLFYRITKKILYKSGARSANILTTVSEYSKRSIGKWLGIQPNIIHVVPNAVSNLFFASYDKESAIADIKSRFGVEKIILFVSRLEPRKNHALVLQAYLELGLYEQGYCLVLLGDRSMKTPVFDALMNNLPSKARACILVKHDVVDKDMVEFYRAARVFVYPSKAEGFGIPPLEAAAARVPVLCSDSTSMSEFTFFGTDQFDPQDYEAFKNKLYNILQNSTDKTILEKRAAIIQEQYNWQRSAEILYGLIKTDSIK